MILQIIIPVFLSYLLYAQVINYSEKTFILNKKNKKKKIKYNITYENDYIIYIHCIEFQSFENFKLTYKKIFNEKEASTIELILKKIKYTQFKEIFNCGIIIINYNQKQFRIINEYYKRSIFNVFYKYCIIDIFNKLNKIVI